MVQAEDALVAKANPGAVAGRVTHGVSHNQRRALPTIAAVAALALIAMVGLASQPSKETELFGIADKWKADEDSMTLGVADDLAKASLRQSQESLNRDHTFGGTQLAAKPMYSRGLGNRISNLEAVSQRLRLKQEQIENVVRMDRTKAHFLRVGASSDVSDAKHELKSVYKLDKTLKGIKADAKKKKAMFREGSQAVKEKHEQLTKLKKNAKSVEAEVQSLRNKVAKLMHSVHKDKNEEANDKDKEDAERELLSSALVKRDRRVKRVDKVEGSLDRMQKRFAKLHEAAKPAH